jgi:hypothetical protein
MAESYKAYRKRRLAQSNLGLEIFALGGVDEDLLKARQRRKRAPSGHPHPSGPPSRPWRRTWRLYGSASAACSVGCL